MKSALKILNPRWDFHYVDYDLHSVSGQSQIPDWKAFLQCKGNLQPETEKVVKACEELAEFLIEGVGWNLIKHDNIKWGSLISLDWW